MNVATGQALTAELIRPWAATWYQALDAHTPIEELLGYLDLDELYMRFPEGEFRGLEGFQRWYGAALNTYFDEHHTLLSLDVHPLPEGAELDILVRWQSRTWEIGTATSQLLGFDINQTWQIVTGTDGSPKVRSYIVGTVAPMAGSPEPAT